MPPSLFLFRTIFGSPVPRHGSTRIDRSLVKISLLLPALLLLVAAACGGPQRPLVHYTVTTQSPMVCCRSMHFAVAEFSATSPTSMAGDGVIVRFPSERFAGDCVKGAETPVVIANRTARDVFIPTSHELEGSRIKLYPWRQHHDSARGAIRLARQIQYGDMFEHSTDARLRLMRLPAGREVRLTASVPGQWLCTKPTELYEGYLQAELDPAFYSQRSRGLRTSPYEQARELVSPIGMRYDVVWVTLEFLERLPVSSRTVSSAGDTIAVQLAVKEEPAAFLNAEQKVASSNVIEMLIEK
jgi:hypothetical protein